jgi:hypothetical protein
MVKVFSVRQGNGREKGGLLFVETKCEKWVLD